MARTSLHLLALLVAFSGALALASRAAAQAEDPMALGAQLRELDREGESVNSGLAEIRRELLAMMPGRMDEMGAARLTLTLEDHFFGMTPVSVSFALDGQRLFHSDDVAQIERGAMFSGAIPSGPHVLSVDLVYRGDVLYTTGYRAHITSSFGFDTSLGRTTRVRVVGRDTSPIAAPPDRWTLDFGVETERDER